MMNTSCNKQIIVVADDFTGANDVGVSLAEAGFDVDVLFGLPYGSQAPVMVLNSDSRACLPSAAAMRVEEMLSGSRAEWFVKKIDSTLRGNPGAETEAMMAAAHINLAIIAPAFPAAGRITQDGQCWVSGSRLTDTEFATDPKTPVKHDDIAAIFEAQSRLRCVSIKKENLAAEAFTARSAYAGEKTALIIDAQSDDELAQIIHLIGEITPRPLLVGSAGLCEAFARHVGSQRVKTGLLAIVGSMSGVAQKQIQAATTHPHCQNIYIDIHELLIHGTGKYQHQIIPILEQGDHCLVHTCPDNAARYQIDVLCQRFSLSRAQLGEKIAALLGELVREVLHVTQPKALYLSGGDIAIAIAQALGATGFQIKGRVSGCVPYGTLRGCSVQQTVFTKAGGFGDENTLLNILHFIEEKLSD